MDTIRDDFFVNPNAWHVKAPLVVYTTVKMHKVNRVLWPFRFQQSILVAPQVLDDLHCIDLRQLDTYWLAFHSQYINIWNNRWQGGPITSAHTRTGPYSLSTDAFTVPPLSSILGVVHTWAISFPDDGDTTMMYRPSMRKVPMESAIVIPSAYGTQHS
ncbi:hypothetical protein Goari_023950 [Gossypium aridum]|uniref:Uncharacterized protein n=1 Tax=Gossypium aridum TaxID=34290 RepID=A0A7J8X4L0_GOSAI|nr:hypothetical protein [Gossypium aridum]